MTKAKKEQKQEEILLYLVYDELVSGGAICDGEEDSSFPSHEDAYHETTFHKLTRNPPRDRMFYHSFPIANPELLKCEKLFAAVVFYSDGDTFGQTHGYWSIEGVYRTYQEADNRLKEVSDPSYTGYVPWKGYFASFESSQVVELYLTDD